MTNKLELYHCEICGNLVEILLPGEGELVCCGKPMHILVPKVLNEEGAEKHVPTFVKNECGNTVIHVGSIPHPMTSEHYIEFVQCVSENRDKVCTKFLKPGDTPKMLLGNEFSGFLSAREYCNIHGLWEGNND